MGVPTAWHSAWVLSAFFAFFFATVAGVGAAAPPWLEARPGQTALVGAAPWPMSEPEAALTATERSAAISPDDAVRRPEDALHLPIGLRVTILAVYLDAVALVRLAGGDWTAYARLDQLVPEVPVGTRLVVAGGFGNSADLYGELDARAAPPEEIPTGTPLLTLGMGIAPFDPDGSAFIRLKILITGGRLRGRSGWIPVGFTGIPTADVDAASSAERTCSCRVLEFR